jgi:hypothetical protein
VCRYDFLINNYVANEIVGMGGFELFMLGRIGS